MRGYLYIIILAAALFALPMIGCGGSSEDDTARTDWTQEDDTAPDFGDYTGFDDEEPGFGDPEILAMGEDTPYNDPFDSPSTKAQSADEQNVIYIKVMWGNLIRDRDDKFDPNDYSGTITIDDGLLVIERTILFEGHDFEIDNREDPTLVSWHSTIWPHYDGLLLRLEPGATADEKNFLHVNIGLFSAVYSVEELLNMLVLAPAGYDDDQIAIASVYGHAGFEGFLQGNWRDLPRHDGGVFKGKWETAPGVLLGHELCRYFPNGDGTGEIYGKYIDTEGHFMGLLEGNYKRTSAAHQAGTFDLEILDEALQTVGYVDGVYFKKNDNGKGFALGIWYQD